MFGTFRWLMKKQKCKIFGMEFIALRGSVKPVPPVVETAVESFKSNYSGRKCSVLDMCCGVGPIGACIKKLMPNIISDISFSDINIYNILSLKDNIKNLGINAKNIWLSDCLDSVPKSSKFDIIILNPPHFDYKPSRNILYNLEIVDENWDFHKRFLHDCQNYLNKNSEIWLFEHSDGMKKQVLETMIRKNKTLRFVNIFDCLYEGKKTKYYYCVAKKSN